MIPSWTVIKLTITTITTITISPRTLLAITRAPASLTLTLSLQTGLNFLLDIFPTVAVMSAAVTVTVVGIAAFSLPLSLSLSSGSAISHSLSLSISISPVRVTGRVAVSTVAVSATIPLTRGNPCNTRNHARVSLSVGPVVTHQPTTSPRTISLFLATSLSLRPRKSPGHRLLPLCPPPSLSLLSFLQRPRVAVAIAFSFVLSPVGSVWSVVFVDSIVATLIVVVLVTITIIIPVTITSGLLFSVSILILRLRPWRTGWGWGTRLGG